MKLTFPHMGNTYIAAKALLDDLGTDYVIPPFNSKKALEIGTKYVPELACLPLKINLGNFIQAYQQGADTILITGGRGPCRFGYYCEMHREILRDIGYEMDVIVLEVPKQGIGELLKRVEKIAGKLNVIKIVKAFRNSARITKEVDELERLTFRLRPREVEKGSVDRIYKKFQKKVLDTKGTKAVRKLISETSWQLGQLKIDESLKPMRVGIVGEIYTTIDSWTNFDISALLGKAGIEVYRDVTVSSWVYGHMLKSALHLPRDMRYAEAAKPYLGAMIGGHALETVGNSVLYAQQGFDGIIQIYPLTCMPEIVAESILPAIEKDYGIPVMTLILDEMTGEAGYLTRVEAFIDLMKRRREISSIGKEWLLSGN